MTGETISVLIPTRGRPGPLACTVRLLRQLATNPGRIEILLYIDDDDPVDYEGEVWPKFAMRGARPVHGRVIRGPRFGYERLNECFNRLAAAATGRWCLFWNDDVYMATPYWDLVLDGIRDEIAIALTECNHGRSPCIFPFFTRGYRETVGHVSLNTHSDTWLEEVGTEAGVAVDVPILVLHAMLDDELAREGKARIGDTSSSYYSDEAKALRAEDVRLIKAALAKAGKI